MYAYFKLIIQFVSFVRTDVELDVCFIRLLLYPHFESFDASSNIIVSCETPAVLIVFLVPKSGPVTFVVLTGFILSKII